MQNFRHLVDCLKNFSQIVRTYMPGFHCHYSITLVLSCHYSITLITLNDCNTYTTQIMLETMPVPLLRLNWGKLRKQAACRCPSVQLKSYWRERTCQVHVHRKYDWIFAGENWLRMHARQSSVGSERIACLYICVCVFGVSLKYSSKIICTVRV